MEKNRYRELLQYLLQRGGSTLRTAVTYTDDDWRTLYLRDDVDTATLDEWMDTYIDHLRDDDPYMPRSEYPALGSTRATVELHDDGVIMHFPTAEAEGLAISMELEVAQNLSEFVDRCRHYLVDG